MNEIICADCLEVLKSMPDKSVDLVLTDPPYGIGIAANPVRQRFEREAWDKAIPAREYFDEMRRVSRNQVIWGGNYFAEYLGNTKRYLVWNKRQPENFTLAMCEMAWTSFNSPAKLFTQSVMEEGNEYHPTQKPVELMRWCLSKYSDEGDTILDPFAGSGTTCVAAKILGRKYIGIEISPVYAAIARKRVEQAQYEERLDFCTMRVGV